MTGMWTHDCPIEGRHEVGLGEPCNWCGADGTDVKQTRREPRPGVGPKQFVVELDENDMTAGYTPPLDCRFFPVLDDRGQILGAGRVKNPPKVFFNSSGLTGKIEECEYAQETSHVIEGAGNIKE